MPLTLDAVRTMAESYAQAWSSHDPQAVASFYEEDGRITINHGDPTIGRAAIAAVAQSFYDDFPDLVVYLDEIRLAGQDAIFLWTLEGANNGPGGTGNRVRVSGWEAWRLSENCRVAKSMGYFDAVEYARQIAEGI